MVRRCFNPSVALFLIGVGAWSSYDDAHAGYFANCLGSLFQSSGQKLKSKSMVDFGQEIKRDGLKRLLVKDIPKVEVPSEEKLWGFFKETNRSEKWYWRVGTDISQFFPRQISRKMYGKPFDFVPYRRIFEGTERFILRGKRLTAVPRLLAHGYVGFKAFEYTWMGLSDRYLTAKEQEKFEQDLDYLMRYDYRFRDAKTREEAAAIRAQYIAYDQIMEGLAKEGVRYDDPMATMAIVSDSSAMKTIGSLFTDVANVTDPDFYVDKPYIDASLLKPKDADLVHELMKINHIKISLETNTEAILDGSVKNSKDAQAVFEAIKKDPFYQTLKKKLNAKEITPEQARYAFDQKVEWASRLKMFKKVGVVPYQISKDGEITRDTLHIQDLEREFLEQLQKKK